MTTARFVPHRGVLILVLGILSVAGACLPLGPFAWIMGKGDLEKIDSGQMDPEGRGMTLAGMVCGMVGTGIMILGLLSLVAALVFVVVGTAAATAN
jgi:hypothetical protein